MKCPICDINHRTKHIAERCKSQIDNEWAHFVILCSSMPGGVTEENLLKYEFMNISYFREVKQKKEAMEKYFNKLN